MNFTFHSLTLNRCAGANGARQSAKYLSQANVFFVQSEIQITVTVPKVKLIFSQKAIERTTESAIFLTRTIT